MKKARTRKTTVGVIGEETLAYTAGKDVTLDLALIAVDCLGSAAHVTMLSRMPVKPRLFSPAEVRLVCAELASIAQAGRAGRFPITLADQDVHLAVERTLTERLGDAGKRIHTGRSRNDQVALDLRLYAREQLLGAMEEVCALADAWIDFARAHDRVPMPGRTHMQPAMPSSIGLWASSFAEMLLDDLDLLETVYRLNDRSPLGSAASYGVPLPIDRALVADLLGLDGPCHNVLYANNARGKMESVALAALSQVMLTLSRAAQDLLIFTMPEFGYFELAEAFTTGSSIMPQKRNADVLELMRAKASRVQGAADAAYHLVKGLPTGYNRDLQEAKELFMEGFQITRSSVSVLRPLVQSMKVREDRLRAGFTPDIYATDRALELVAEGMPFRDAYHHVKAHLDELEQMDADTVLAKKRHLGAPAGLDYDLLSSRVKQGRAGLAARWKKVDAAYRRLLGFSVAG